MKVKVRGENLLKISLLNDIIIEQFDVRMTSTKRNNATQQHIRKAGEIS